MDAIKRGRMQSMDLPQPLNPKDSAATVIHWHNVSRQCGDAMLEAAMRAGKVLIDQRELHGTESKRGGSGFYRWCCDNLPFHEGQARRYIKIAENWDELRRARRSSDEPLSIRGALKLIAEKEAATKPKPAKASSNPVDAELIDNRPVSADRTIRELRTVEPVVKDSLTTETAVPAQRSLTVEEPTEAVNPPDQDRLWMPEATPRGNGRLFHEPEPVPEPEPELMVDRARRAIQMAINEAKALGKSPEGDDYRVEDVLSDLTRAQRTLEKSAPAIERQVEKIRLAYPRKVGRPTAEKAIRKALGRATFDHLYERTTAYAAAVMDADPDLIPHPGTWFNDERWDDSEREWQASAGLERKRREGEQASRRNGRSVSDYLDWADRRTGVVA